jgi:hypothetical protein
MAQPRDPNYKPKDPKAQATIDGERTARQLGWSELMRKWLLLAGDRLQNAADPAGAAQSNLALSRGIAFLFDMPDPQVLA